MSRMSERPGCALVIFIVSMLCIAAILTAKADSNLPVVCTDPAADGASMFACANTAQLFTPAGSDSLVRVCSSASCSFQDKRWRKLSSVTAGEFVEVCTADKAPGALLVNCQGTTALPWGAMASVPASQVVQAVENPAPAFPGTFTITPSSGRAPLDVTIAWEVKAPAGTTCAGSGSWTGAKALKGSQTIKALGASANYTLTCTEPGGTTGKATLSWVAPTTNTDGSTLTNLAGFRVLYGQASTALSQIIEVPGASVSTYEVAGLSLGSWFFAVRATNSAGAESANSNVGTKVVTAAAPASYSATQAVTVEAVPSPPTLQVIAAEVFNATADYAILAFRPSLRYGSAPLGTPCDETKPVRGGFYPVPLAAVKWSSSGRTKYPVARCAPSSN